MLRPEDFDFELPEQLIAGRPLARRDASRMMVLDRGDGSIRHDLVTNFASYLEPGDLVVGNDTRVVAARFFSDDGKKEILRTADLGSGQWRCLVRPGRKMRVGDEIVIGGARGVVEEVQEDGERILFFENPPKPEERGHLALPPYMGREEEPADRERYQTVYADEGKAGSVAAPTAGLHFTEEMMASIPHAFLTLHVGPGTFRPVQVDLIEDHPMHREEFHLGTETARRIADAERVVSIGTTTARVLEHLAQSPDGVQAGSGSTDIFIRPGHEFGCVDALLTNFHLPRSTLLMLCSALAGREFMLEAYAEAVREKYRFFSYGDCMLIL